eukprot:4497160-Pyramimonas_sp.AAC.1
MQPLTLVFSTAFPLILRLDASSSSASFLPPPPPPPPPPRYPAPPAPPPHHRPRPHPHPPPLPHPLRAPSTLPIYPAVPLFLLLLLPPFLPVTILSHQRRSRWWVRVGGCLAGRAGALAGGKGR